MTCGSRLVNYIHEDPPTLLWVFSKNTNTFWLIVHVQPVIRPIPSFSVIWQNILQLGAQKNLQNKNGMRLSEWFTSWPQAEHCDGEGYNTGLSHWNFYSLSGWKCFHKRIKFIKGLFYGGRKTKSEKYRATGQRGFNFQCSWCDQEQGMSISLQSTLFFSGVISWSTWV